MIRLVLKDAASIHVHHVKQWPDPVTPKCCRNYDNVGSNRMVDYDFGWQHRPTV
jgi:hypothetical protein